VIALLTISFFLVSCGKSEKDVKAAEMLYHECVSNGVEYFKEIGAYPTLQSEPNKGRHAIEVARERCERAPATAFSRPNQ
ncbi:hypothetical protein, partial [Rheinheimera mesophila]|uniref:hypothetical protein n=1 Tax=Rheinheimera mesophila TaxID=1547515 RepID=UPI0006266C9B